MLTLQAFGALDFRDDACASMPALLAQPKRSALLAYLVLAPPGSFCRRDTLLALFWPELNADAGRHALSQALSFLRRHVSEGILLTRGPEEVGVDPARVRSDVLAFQQAVATGQWGAALDHYHGDLLEGLHVAGAAPFVDWVDRERERLREAAADAAWRHAHALMAGGRLVEAERAGQMALRLVPTDESAVREFIRALAAGGDRAAALRFYEKFAAVLEQELEVEPAVETRAVAKRIRDGDVVLNERTPPSRVITPLPFPPVAETTASPGMTPAKTQKAISPRKKRLAGGGVAAGVAVIAVLAYVALRPDPLDVTVTDIQPVTSEPGVEWLPALSPDGNDVAYVVGEGVFGQPHVRIRPTESVPGGGEVRLTDPSLQWALLPTWTADGASVRVLACRAEAPCTWRESGSMGGTQRAATLPPGVPDTVREMAWSPDGDRVAFHRSDTLFVASETEGVGIYSYPLDPPEPVSIRDGVPVVVSRQWVFSSDVSPDGKWIVYDSNVRGNSDIYKMPLPSGDPVRLTDAPGDELWGMWSPDGREIVFNGSPDPPEVGQYEIFLMSADGGTPVQLTRAARKGLMNVWPYWSPDGLKLAYSSWRGTGGAINDAFGLVMSRDSVGGAWGEPVKFADPKFSHGIWAPDGKSVFMSPNWDGEILLELSIEGDTLFKRDIAGATQLRWWAKDMIIRRPPGSRTLYSRGVARDGSEGYWAIPDLGRGEPRQIVKYDDPGIRVMYPGIGPDRAYLNLERHESDIWVATLKR